MRFYVFKTEGNGLFSACIEAWSDNGFSYFHKTFMSAKERGRWIKDRTELLKIIPPIHPEPDPEWEEWLQAA